MKLTIVGSGDAFGSGGRFQTCFDVQTADARFLIDFGASAPVAINRAGIALNDIDAIFISHLHGDHFGGLPFAILQSAHIEKRTRPLTIFGPPGIEARYMTLAEAIFAQMTKTPRPFELTFSEMSEGSPTCWQNLSVHAFEVEHPSGAPSHGLRFECAGKVLAYSGDSQWCDNIVNIGRNADLFLLECYAYDKDIPWHMNWQNIRAHLDDIAAHRIVLTHMSAAMLDQADNINEKNVVAGADGMTFKL